jgi:hypothetical protein
MPRSSTVSLPRKNHGVSRTTWLKGRRHENIEAIQEPAMMELTSISKEAFTSCFQESQKRWQQCTECGGNYFEGDRKHYL